MCAPAFEEEQALPVPNDEDESAAEGPDVLAVLFPEQQHPADPEGEQPRGLFSNAVSQSE